MDWDFRGSASSLDVYKYRRQSDRNDLFNNRIISGRSYEEKIVEDNRTKTYAILQESRSDFKNNKLRYFLLIYSENAWKIFNVAVLLCAYILDTCVYTFFIENERSLWLIMLIFCLNLMFTCDVVIIVGLKMSKKWRKTLNLVEPETWRVILDVILAVPYSFLYLVKFDFTVFDLHAIAPLAALIRIYRIIEYFYTKSLQAGSNQWTAFLSQYLTLFILSVHTWTCIWFLYSFRSFDISKLRQSWSISSINLPTETTFEWYFVCAYWSVMFLTTNALGDLYPVTTTERLAASVAILLGFLLTTVVFVGSMTSQFITITTRRSNYVRQLMKIKNHLRLIRMDIDTTNRIISYYKDLWYQKSGVFEPKLMELLPCPLRMEICYDLNAVPLYSSLIFRRLPDAFLRRLSLAMSHRFYLPGDIVYDHNHNKTMMVCVTNGVLELLSDEDDETPMVSFTKGTCLGETSLVYNIPARCTVKAATYLECQVLKKTEFIKLMMTYPELVDKMRKEIEERINRCKFKKLERVQTHLLLNVYASTDRKKSRIKSLKDKLRYIQGLTDIEPSKDDKLDDNCLDLYIISEHIKKKTTKFTCINPKFPWILTSGCDLVIYWELYMLLIIFYICLIYPFFIGIKRVFPGGYFFYTEIVITASLVLNIIITCTTAVKTKKKHMDNFWSIVNYRMNTLGFYLDTVAIIPFEYIVTIHNTTYYRDNYRDHLFYLCKGVKLCLIWRLSSFFEALERKLSLNSLIVKISKYCVYICILCYWSGVILYMESCFISRCSEESWFSKAQKSQGKLGVLSKTEYPLLTSLYFATTLLLSVGFGDFTPGDKYDMTIVAFLSLYGVLLVGFCVSEFSAVVTHWSRTKTSFLEVIMTIDKFMKENNMHRAIKTRIMSFYQLQWQYNLGVELTGENWLEKTVVPLELRKKVLHQARFKALTSIRLFQVKNKAYVHKLTESARDIILPPGEIVYYGGTVTRELYIIESGYCVVTSKENREAKYGRVIGPGNHLELLALLYGVPAVSTVVTLTHCKLISISYSAYSSALSLFPDMREHDGLLTAEELLNIERQARTQVSGAVFLSHYNQLTMKSQLLRITNTLQDFLQDSFINVYTDYQSKQQSYIKSYKQFKVLKSIAPYLLLPIAIKPDGIFLKTWAIIRVFTAIMLCLLTPIIVSMAPQCTYFNIPETVLECICYADMYLMLHVAFYGSKNQLIYHPYLTAKNYLTKAFTADLLICLPWHAIWKLFVPKHDEGHTVGDHAKSPHKFHCILRMVNISQIYKLYTAFSADSIGALKRAYLMTVLQFLILTLFFLNLYASILITMTCRYVLATDPEDFHRKVSTLKGSYRDDQFHPNGNMVCQLGSWIDASKITKEKYLSPMKVYLLAYYWAATSLCGAGFGDITVQDTRHMILSIFILVHGVMFFGYVYAKIASLKAMADQVETKFLENMKHLELFLDGERVPFSIKKIIMEYWKYQWKRTGGWSHQSILGKLHANLNEDAVLYMYEKTLREIPLFENVEYSFFRAFAKMLSERYFQKGYMVMRANEVMSKMYIIYRGKVDIITDTNEVEACMGPGGIFGNIKGAYKYLTMSNVTASRNIDLLCIEGAEFYALLKGYPKVLKKVKYSVGTAAKDYVIPTMGSDRCSIAFGSVPLTYEADYDEEEEDDLDIFTVWDSPDRSLAESHGSRSITSVGNVDYAAATFLIFLPHKWFRSSVIPDCKMVIFMEYLTLFLAYIEFMILVYQMAFLSNPYFLYISVVTDCIFLYKIFLDVHTGYMNRYGDYVLHPKKVRHMYFSKVYHRRRDFLANFTVCYLVFALNLREPMNTAFFCYLRAPQLLRISYLFTYRMHRKINIGSANLFVKLTAIVIWASILSHVNACLFFKLSCLTPEQCNSGNWMSKEELNLKVNYSEGNYFPLYIASLWYMLNLITITGMGDVSAQNDFEVVETIIIVIVIKFCTGLLISEMSAMITAHSSSLISYDYRINELKDGLRDMDLSDHQLTKMWDYVRELWNRQQGRQVPKFIHKLPFRLHCQVMHAVYGGHIKESVIFSKTDEHFRRMLSMWMTHCVFFPGNYIVQCGDSDQCIYFIHRGEVEVLTVHPNLTEYIYDILGPEDSFGIAQGLFVGVAHHFSFRARTVVDIVYLKLDDWKYLLDFYPKSAKIVQKKVANVYLAI